MSERDSGESWSWVGDIEVIEGQTIELEYGIPQLPKKKKHKKLEEV